MNNAEYVGSFSFPAVYNWLVSSYQELNEVNFLPFGGGYDIGSGLER